jgi:hypothetical protein
VGALKRAVTVSLGRLASQAIGWEEKRAKGHASAGAAQAIRCYLNDRGRAGAGWSYPSFLDQRPSGEDIELKLSIDEMLWRSLEEEAERQRVSATQMLEHAVLYFAAEVDGGRAAERILDDLESA